jgi:hypothetical protein
MDFANLVFAVAVVYNGSATRLLLRFRNWNFCDFAKRWRVALNGNFVRIVLKNSVLRRERPNWQNIVLRKRHFANNVFQKAVYRDFVPIFRCDFRLAEFFNTISAKQNFL